MSSVTSQTDSIVVENASVGMQPVVPAENPGIDYRQAESTGRQMHRARQIFAYGGLDGVMNRPLMHEDGLYPQFVVKAKGYELFDSTGATYIDWISGWGSIILGHCHKSVRDAIVDQADVCTSIGLMHPVEIDVAELIIEMVPCAEMVAFGKNGSDALNGALRIARAATGRELVLQCGFHGFHDWYTCLNPKVQGVLPALRDFVKPFEYNNLDSLRELFEQNKDKVAAVVMEPVNMYIPDEGYLESVKQIAHENGAVLIWDEVVTAFRLARGGAQEYFGVQPDIAVLGKAMAGGLPLSAITGSRELMRHLPRAAFGMTYRGETISLAAARACLTFLRNNDVSEHLERIGTKLRNGFHQLCRKHGIECELQGPSARMTFVFNQQGALQWNQLRSMFVLECLKNGVLTNGNAMVSFAHDEQAVAKTLAVYEIALLKLRKAIDATTDESTQGTEFAQDAGAVLIKGCVDAVIRNKSGRTLSGWALVDGVVVDKLTAVFEDGRRIESQINPRPDIQGAFPKVENGSAAGFKIELPGDVDESGKRFRLIARVGETDRFHCLVVDDTADSNEPRRGPHWFRDGVLFI